MALLGFGILGDQIVRCHGESSGVGGPSPYLPYIIKHSFASQKILKRDHLV